MEVMGIHMALGMSTAILYLMEVSAMGTVTEVMVTAMSINMDTLMIMAIAMDSLMVRIIAMMTIVLRG